MLIDNQLICGRIGSKISGNIESKNTLSLLKEFLNEEEIWGYTFPRPSSLEEVWHRDWDSLLKLVADSYKSKIVRIHPDINNDTAELATQLTTTFNILKSRIKRKINPVPLSKGVQFIPKIKPQTRKFCPVCEKAFERGFAKNQYKRIYCSEKCKNTASKRAFRAKRKIRIEKKCECGIIFYTTNWRKKFHSRKCMMRQWFKNHPRRKR